MGVVPLNVSIQYLLHEGELFGFALQEFPQGGGVGEVDGGDAGLPRKRVESFGFHVRAFGNQQFGDALLSAEGGVVERC